MGEQAVTTLLGKPTLVSPVVVYNGAWSNKKQQESIWALLPDSHAFGDTKTLLPDGKTLEGRKAHDEYADPKLRVATRKRCTVTQLTASHIGVASNRISVDPFRLLACFTCVPDWQASGLDAESFFLLDPSQAATTMPRVGPYAFHFTAYVGSMYEDLTMSLMTMKASALQMGVRLHLKIVPLGVGPTIRTRNGSPLGPVLMPAYLTALHYACLSLVDSTWCEVVEFVDHTPGRLLSPCINVSGVVTLSGHRDALDYSHSQGGMPAIVAPCDAFCRIGGVPTDKYLSATLANNTNLRDILSLKPTFVGWPTK